MIETRVQHPRKTWPYRVQPGFHGNDPRMAEALDWCAEHFGPKGSINDGRWYKLVVTFYFADESDAAWFKLRWFDPITRRPH